jgi:hypothetical protein
LVVLEIITGILLSLPDYVSDELVLLELSHVSHEKAIQVGETFS